MTTIDKYSRLGLDVVSAATSFGFSAAKIGTRLGFSITRGIASTAVGLTGSVVDYGLFGGRTSAGPALSSTISSVLSIVEQITLAPILLSESLTSTSFTAAFSSLNLLSTVFPESDEASFSLASFVQLIRREWEDPVGKNALPEKRYSVLQVAKALMAWAALQGLTSKWQENRWSKHLREIQFNTPPPKIEPRTRKVSQLHVTTDVTFPGGRGQIIAADIGEASNSDPSTPTEFHNPGRDASNAAIKLTFRRLSKLVLAGYGGASLLFFGITPSAFSSASTPKGDESNLAEAVDASEAEAAAPSQVPSMSWWNMLLGRHDHDIFQLHARESHDDPPVDAIIGDEHHMPRFWVLCDHRRKQIVLIIRGTMSLNDLAVDLTCDPADFRPAQDTPLTMHAFDSTYSFDELPDEEEYTFVNADDIIEAMPGSYPGFINCDFTPSSSFDGHSSFASDTTSVAEEGSYQVHGGIYKMALAMGGVGRPVWMVVRNAMKRNKGYDLCLSGHSLGSGLSALLALMWADPKTCLTVRSSGLPPGRKVQAYLFGPPCLADTALCKLSSSMIHSFIYSHDIVSRLSLGSARDMTLAATWLCAADEKGNGEGYAGIARRALMAKAGYGDTGNADWFLSIRKTLEANMQMAHLYPPGRIWWARREVDLDPTHREAKAKTSRKMRLFEVENVEKVFRQIVFAGDMLSSHMPHQYDNVIQEL